VFTGLFLVINTDLLFKGTNTISLFPAGIYHAKKFIEIINFKMIWTFFNKDTEPDMPIFIELSI